MSIFSSLLCVLFVVTFAIANVRTEHTYVQHFNSARYLFAPRSISKAFPQVPIHQVSQFLQSKSNRQLMFVLLQNGTLLQFSSPPISPLKITMAPKFKTIVFGNAVIEPHSIMQWKQDDLVIVSAKGHMICNLSSNKCAVTTIPLGKVTSLAIALTSGNLFVGSDQGLFVIEPNGRITRALNEPVTALTWAEDSQILSVSTIVRFLSMNLATGFQRFEFNEILEGPATGLSHMIYNGSLLDVWVGTPSAVFVQQTNQDYSITRIGKITDVNVRFGPGLPFNNITIVTNHLPNGDVWLGTTRGAIRFHYPSQSWHYYYGPRYLVGETVCAIGFEQSSDDNRVYSAWIATESGISRITVDPTYTLVNKALLLESRIPSMFTRMGLHAVDCSIAASDIGDDSACSTHNGDNDGLWTSMYLGSQAFRYAVTKEPAVKKHAWDLFETMERLIIVTGVNGLMARSYTYPSDPTAQSSQWHNSTTIPNLRWKGDTSSDEVTGHLFVYPLIYDLVAETAEEKQRVLSLIVNITDYIIDNDYYLIDVTGKPTTWGYWNPHTLNNNPEKYGERGINSLEVLAWLVSAYRLTGNAKYLDSFQYLTANQFLENLINQKITTPCDINYSDDELTFLAYYTYFYALNGLSQSQRQKFGEHFFQKSFSNAFNYIRGYKASLWNFIYAAWSDNTQYDKQQLINAGVWNLQTWPLDQLKWQVNNSARTDIILNPEALRDGKIALHSSNVLPYDEIPAIIWNSSMFTLIGGNGQSEFSGKAFLLPYWLAKYHRFL